MFKKVGQAGRDGKPSSCTILYNGLLSTYCSPSMKRFLINEDSRCLRQMIMEEFGYSFSTDNISHKCCNVCAVRCKCGDEHCGSTSFVTIRDETTQSVTVLAESSVVRSVSANEKAELKQLLLTYKKKLIEQEVQGMASTVGVPNVFLEFSWLPIIQIIQTCHKLFTVEDVLKNVEIWRKTHAVAVLDAVAQVFGDITIEHEMSMLGEAQKDKKYTDKYTDKKLFKFLQSVF